jgi:hypothetical protein
MPKMEYVRQLLSKLTKARRALNAVSVVVREVLGIMMVAYLYPSAITALSEVVTEGWDDPVANLWALMPIFAVISGLILIISPVLEVL